MSEQQYDIQEDARLTAYALGELDERELAAVEALIEREPEARAFVDEVRATAELLDVAADGDAGLTDAQRSVIEARIASAHAGSRRSGFRILRNRPLVSGVAAALVTTVAGLFVAIPAVIAYNHFLAKLNLVSGELEGFSSEFIGTLAREGRV